MVTTQAHLYISNPAADDLIFAFSAQEIILRDERYLPTFADISLTQQNLKLEQYYCFAHYHGRRCLLLGDAQLLQHEPHLSAVNLRRSYPLLPEEEFQLAFLGKHLFHWRQNSQFCGRCGVRQIDKTEERAFCCPACKAVLYPRLSPVVIVLITRGDELLLARSPHFQPGVYSALAGFVEAAETLEQAAHREVREEVGINIQNLRYVCSGAWPFPDSLMMGFIADYASGEIVMDEHEIEDAAWFSRWNLPTLPSPVSIAYRLIQEYFSKLK